MLSLFRVFVINILSPRAQRSSRSQLVIDGRAPVLKHALPAQWNDFGVCIPSGWNVYPIECETYSIGAKRSFDSTEGATHFW